MSAVAWFFAIAGALLALVAGGFGIGKGEYFELDSPAAREVPRVELGS